MRGGTSAARGPGAARSASGRDPAGCRGNLRPARPGDAVVIAPVMASGDRTGRLWSYLVRFRRCPVGNSRKTVGVTLFKAKDKRVNVLVRKPAGADSAGAFTIVMAGGRPGLTWPRSR